MPETCDGYSVAAIIADRTNPWEWKYLTIERSDGLGEAFVAGHRDPHGDLESAVRAEIDEEVGLKATTVAPAYTITLPNKCSGKWVLGGEHRHEWTIFHADVTDFNVRFDPREVSGWHLRTKTDLQKLADTTVNNLRAGRPLRQWVGPFLEPPQALWMSKMELVDLDPRDYQRILDNCKVAPARR